GIRNSSVTGVQTCALPILRVDRAGAGASPCRRRDRGRTRRVRPGGGIEPFLRRPAACGRATSRGARRVLDRRATTAWTLAGGGRSEERRVGKAVGHGWIAT